MLTYAESLSQLDFPLLMAVYAESNREALLNDCGPDAPSAEERFHFYLKYGFFTCPGAKYALWHTTGRYAAALRLRPWQDGLVIEGLETTPALRQQGFATRLIRAVQADQHAPLYAHVSKANAASLAVFAACDFIKLLNHAQYTPYSERLAHMCTLTYTGKQVAL